MKVVVRCQERCYAICLSSSSLTWAEAPFTHCNTAVRHKDKSVPNIPTLGQEESPSFVLFFFPQLVVCIYHVAWYFSKFKILMILKIVSDNIK